MPTLADRALALAARAPHQFTLQYPPSRDYFREHFARPVPRATFARARLLYVHVPFCEQRCAYCNFAVDVRTDEARKARYVDGLLERIAALPPHAGADGIDVGGGTPTLLPRPLLARLFGALAGRGPVSTETTPSRAADPALLETLVAAGVTRLSLGVQSTDEATLAAVGRPTASLARALGNARAAGFSRVSCDLVFGLPGQGVEDFARDLARVVALGPDAVTTYDCLYRGKGRALSGPPPPPAALGAAYDRGHALLTAAGYHAPYGSLNFSRHAGETGTSAYFERRVRDGEDYLGLGDHASSLTGSAWAFSTRGVDAWIAAPEGHADAYDLPTEEVMAKHLLLTLSYGRLDRARFLARFGEPPEARFGPGLARALAEGFLVEDAAGWALATFSALPAVRALLHPARAIAWLERRLPRMLTACTGTSSACSAASPPSRATTSARSARSSPKT